MVYADMNTPSANMNLPISQIQEMIRIQNEELIKKEEDAAFREQAKADRDREEHAAYVNEYVNSRVNAQNKRAKFLEETKTALLTAALMKVMKESFSHPMNQRDKITAKNLITNFVKEQGVGDLLNRMKYQNTLVAEMGRIVNEYYTKIVESNNDEFKQPDESQIPGRAMDLKLDKTIVDDFYKDITDLDTSEASKLIRDKVADAMSDFVDQNMQNKLDYQEIIDTAKEKIEDSKETEVAEAYMNEAQRRINELRRTRHKNIFHYVVEAISKEAFKDENLSKIYIHENAVDMDGIVNSAEIIYTMLEMANTIELVPETYIRDYIISLTKV